jgi:hypothetical protein
LGAQVAGHDPERTIWGYRDWVIRAINSGMPFDQFTTEQLAGDLLPNPTEDQLVATAFHRNTLTNNEGGTNDEEFRNVAVVDRVNTTMSVWMGMTMACAQCHSHKFDPISQREYFQVFDIWNQSEDADRRDESPTISWFTPEQRAQRSELSLKIDQVENQLTDLDESLVPSQRKWEARSREGLAWSRIKPSRATSKSQATFEIGETLRIQNDALSDKYHIEWDVDSSDSLRTWSGLAIESIPQADLPGGGAGSGNGNFVLSDVRIRVSPVEAAGVSARYVRVELPGKERILSLAEVNVIVDNENVAKQGKASQSSTSFGGTADRAIDQNTSGEFSKNSVTHSEKSESPWWELDFQKEFSIDKLVLWNRTDGDHASRLNGAVVTLLDSNRKTIWTENLPKFSTSHTSLIKPSADVLISFASADYEQEGFSASHAIDKDKKTGWAVGGSITESHQLQLALDPKSLDKAIRDWNGPIRVQLELDFASNFNRHTLASFGIQTSHDDRVLPYLSIPASVRGLVQKTSRTKEQDEVLARYYASEIAPERTQIRSERAEMRRRLAEMKPMTTVPVMRDLPRTKGRETFVQLRGNYRVHGEKVEGSFLSALHPVSHQVAGPVSRLDFAKWLLQKDNPLTARVVANRYWENLFGVGIVRTSEEFGSQGDLPTHPELLDFLASDLIRLNWDTKAFVRTIVLSAAYRQSSSVTPQRFEEDPENIFVSRGPRFRATAEQIRDSALAVSGLISHRMYGPPTRPPQPNLGLSAAFGGKTDWETSQGEDRFRRGVYTQWRRSNPYPSMATFDAPNREVCVLKRDRTNTPLQALVTLNDPAFVEAAQGLSRRIVLHESKAADWDSRLDRLWETAIGRIPLESERSRIRELYGSLVEELKKTPEQAMQLATDPIGPLPSGADPIELAAWAAICNVVLNLDEFLMKR